MKVLPYVYNFVSEYIKVKYPKKHIVFIDCSTFSTESWNWLKVFCSKNGIEYSDVVISEHLILEFSSQNAAINFCNKVPDGTPYCVVYSKGELVHENT